MDQLRSILVGVDFTPGSATALAQAIRIAQWNRAQLHVIHAIDPLVVTDLEEALTPYTHLASYAQEMPETLEADARAEWQSFAAEIPGAQDLPIEIIIGHPVNTLLRQVQEKAADLLVLGTHGTSPDGGTGTLAAACVRRASTRVLLVRQPQRGPFKTVLVGVDFSDASRKAVDEALRVAAQDNAVVHVLHVFHGPWHRLHYRAPTLEADPDFQKQYRATLLRRLEQFCEPARPEVGWAKPQFHLLDYRSHGLGLVDFARRIEADLVVLGSRGRTNLRELLLGSTAERVVRDTPCSILVIKPKD